jgi:VanZ family protein
MFDNYYVYTLDFYFGVRIFTINSYVCTAGPEIQFDSNHIGSSLAICGKYLYIAMQDTDIRIFSVSNWATPYYMYTLTTYTRVFQTIQGSLRCSSISFAQYLLFQTNSSDGTIWLHIVDTQSNLMANTVANYPIGRYNQSLHSYSADFQNNTGSLLLIDSNSSTLFKINQFKLVFNINNKYCDKSSHENITVSVKNTNNKTSEAKFSLKVNQYSQGSVQSSTIHIWQLALICIGTLALSLFLFILIRKKLLKNRRKVQTNVLFNYSKDFIETFPDINSSFD